MLYLWVNGLHIRLCSDFCKMDDDKMPTYLRRLMWGLHETMRMKCLAWHIVSTQQIQDLIKWVSFQEGSQSLETHHTSMTKNVRQRERGTNSNDKQQRSDKLHQRLGFIQAPKRNTIMQFTRFLKMLNLIVTHILKVQKNKYIYCWKTLLNY